MVAQWKALPPHSSQVLGLLLCFGYYCLRGVSVHVLLYVLQFPPGFLTCRLISCTKLPLSVNECGNVGVRGVRR